MNFIGTPKINDGGWYGVAEERRMAQGWERGAGLAGGAVLS